MAKKNMSSIDAAWLHMEDPTNLMMISVPVNFLDGVVFTKNHHFPVTGWESLKPYSIAIRIGTKFAEIRSETLPKQN